MEGTFFFALYLARFWGSRDPQALNIWPGEPKKIKKAIQDYLRRLFLCRLDLYGLIGSPIK